MRIAVAVLRFLVAITVVAAVAATFATARRPVDPFDFFGYFTIQSNLLAAAAALVSGVALLRRTGGIPLLRGITTTCIALTGLVYNTLLTDVAGGVALPWANLVLHAIAPGVIVLDWLLVGDRPALPWRRIRWVVPYPLVWLAVVLVRGATDGWVPYPFLDPRLGYPVVALYCAAITAAVLALASLVWAASRLHVLPVAAPRAAAGGLPVHG